jgi:ketosteroid isomerase-like protein
MKSTLFVFFALILTCPFGAGQEGSNPTGSKGGMNSQAAGKDLERRFQEYADALTKRDVTALDKMWADDYTFINPRGELVTKAERIANLKSGATEFQTITPRREKLHLHGNVAVDIGRVSLQGTKYGGQKSSGEYRYTNVWVKSGGNWQLLANQVTLIKK